MEPASQLRYSVILYSPPSRPTVPFGIVVYPSDRSRLVFRFRKVSEALFGDDCDVLADTSAYFTQLAFELGAAKMLEWMEDTFSNVLRLEGPFAVGGTDPTSALERLLHTYDIE